MAFNNNVSMAHLDNIRAALEEGGMASCNDIRDTIWTGVSDASRARKVIAARSPENQTVAYARSQVCQEIRRTLSGCIPVDLYIHRATAYKDSERFWVTSLGEDTNLDDLMAELVEAVYV